MIAVIFGGRSCEHNISVITGVTTLNSLGGKAKAIYIDSAGVFWCGDKLSKLETYKKFSKKGLKRVHFMPSDNGVYGDSGKLIFKVDAAVICCHGMGGEDGCLQGLLELSDVPYTCSGVLASAVGMDKVVMKQLFNAAGIPCVKYMGLWRGEYEKGDYDFVSELKENFNFPLIVKPANLGSSIGISIAHDFMELFDKIRIAFKFDNRIIIEEALEDFTEVNCAALGDEDDVEISLTEQPLGWKEFLKYEDKYEGKGKEESKKVMPARISEAERAQVERLTGEVFKAIGGGGVARVDFMLKGGEVFVNEINTVPGSLAYYLFKDKYTLKTLTERLIEIAKKRHAAKNALVYTYKSEYPRRGKHD